MIIGIILTLILVGLNAFFVAAEFAIVKVRASQIEIKIREGNKSAIRAKSVITHLDEYLSATQLGITLASLGLGWIGESVVANLIIDTMALFTLQITPAFAAQIALPIAFILITILHIVFGELAPKSLAIQRPEGVTLAVSLPLKIFYYVFKPFIWLLNSFANKLLRMAGFEAVSEEHSSHTQEELKFLLEESTKSGILQTEEHEIMEKVFKFSQTPVKQIMIPRNKIEGVELSMSKEQVVNVFIDEGFSRMPIYDKNIDNIVGIIYAKNIIDMLQSPNLFILQDLIRPAYFVNEDDKIDKIFRYMQTHKVHIAIVLDEFGGTAGLATLEDIVEEIFGEIQDEDDEEIPDVRPISDTEFIVQAIAIIDDVNDGLPLPLPESDDYETLGGLIIDATERILEAGQVVELYGYRMEIIKASNLMMEVVKLTLLEQEQEYENDKD